MIPAEAVEAAARAICVAHGEWSGYEWDQGIARDRMKAKYRKQATRALEAAAPVLLSHEREQTRLAHLDAMVNRETKRDELAAEYRRGYRDGLIDRKQVTANPGV